MLVRVRPASCSISRPDQLPIKDRMRFAREIANEDEVRKVDQDVNAIVAGATRWSERDYQLYSAIYDAGIAYSDARLGQIIECQVSAPAEQRQTAKPRAPLQRWELRRADPARSARSRARRVRTPAKVQATMRRHRTRTSRQRSNQNCGVGRETLTWVSPSDSSVMEPV